MQHSKRRAALYLLRNDLRLHDNETLVRATANADFLIPVYCFDPRHYGSTHFYRFPKRTGPHRLRFLLESVADLSQSFKDKGSALVLRVGKPETVVPLLVENLLEHDKDLEVSVYYQSEVCSEETSVEKAIARNLPQSVKVHTYWGHTLFHLEDLPFRSMKHLPDVYTQFRTACEREAKIRPTFLTPEKLLPLPPFIAQQECGTLPTPTELGYKEDIDMSIDERSAFPFRGGETAALQRVKEYFWEKDMLKIYKETRDGLVGTDYSSKLSPWLALGCISPRYIYEEIGRYEAERIANRSTYWLFFELLWRDYFKFVGLKYGNSLFKVGGLKDVHKQWKYDEGKFAAWAEGRTGIPWVDANMRELNATGWMSNRGRQNVASFLTKDLGLDWRTGAEYFESLLIDHDPTSNYGNWTYAASVGNDPRENRKFNMIKQAKDYDREGEFVRLWCPELKNIVGPAVHQPWTLSETAQSQVGCVLGKEYPNPMHIDPHWGFHSTSNNTRNEKNKGATASSSGNKEQKPAQQDRNKRIGDHPNQRRAKRQQGRGWEPKRPGGLSDTPIKKNQ